MQTTPEMIRQQQFRVRMRGYDQEEVITYLSGLAGEMEHLLDENTRLSRELETLQSRQADLQELFLQAKKFSDEKLDQARGDARRIITEAEHKAREVLSSLDGRRQQLEQEAEKIRQTAEQQARETRENARHRLSEAEESARTIEDESKQRANALLTGAERSRSTLESQVVDLKAKRASLRTELKAVLETHLSWIKDMDDVDQPQG